MFYHMRLFKAWNPQSEDSFLSQGSDRSKCQCSRNAFQKIARKEATSDLIPDADGSLLGRGGLTLIGGLGAIGSLAAAWAAESKMWQGLRLLGRNGKASEHILKAILSDSLQVLYVALSNSFTNEHFLLSDHGLRVDVPEFLPGFFCMQRQGCLLTFVRCDVASSEDKADILASSSDEGKRLEAVWHAGGVLQVPIFPELCTVLKGMPPKPHMLNLL